MLIKDKITKELVLTAEKNGFIVNPSFYNKETGQIDNNTLAICLGEYLNNKKEYNNEN